MQLCEVCQQVKEIQRFASDTIKVMIKLLLELKTSAGSNQCRACKWFRTCNDIISTPGECKYLIFIFVHVKSKFSVKSCKSILCHGKQCKV